MARHLAPFSCRQRMAESVRRRSWGGVLGRGLALGPALLDQRLQPPPLCVRQHRSSSPGKEQNAIPVRRFKVEQTLAWRRSLCARQHDILIAPLPPQGGSPPITNATEQRSAPMKMVTKKL